MTVREALLVLADGTVFEGEAIGAEAPGGVATGEVVFNTVLSGYQEVITDPSLRRADHHLHLPPHRQLRRDRRRLRGPAAVLPRRRRPRAGPAPQSSWRSDGDLDDLLRRYGIRGIAGIDTRRLTRLIRDAGAMPGAFGDRRRGRRCGPRPPAEPGTDGIDLVAEVTTRRAATRVGDGGRSGSSPTTSASSARSCATSPASARVEVVPASHRRPPTSSPASPTACSCPTAPATRPMVPVRRRRHRRACSAQVPVFGICLGHQLLGRALGAETVKLPFGHHGGNHPVRHLATGRVEITSQNHNFAVDADSLGGRAEVTHVNLNDGVCEGLRVRDAPAFSVQYHPEAGPGPHDSRYLFDEFAADGRSRRARPRRPTTARPGASRRGAA